MSGLVALQHLNLTGCGRVQGDALTALATLTALRYAKLLHNHVIMVPELLSLLPLPLLLL